MSRQVTGPDGREWTVTSSLEWRKPVTADDFEHDVAGGYVAASIMLVVLGLLALVLVVWLPEGVIVPSWVLLALLLIALYFPLRWVLNRPWKIVAETKGAETDELPAERWVGNVRGMFRAPGEVSRVRKEIKRESQPDFEGPLRQLD